MKVVDCKTGAVMEASVSPVSKEHLSFISKSGNFLFDWGKLQHPDIYKLTIEGMKDQTALGLMCIINREDGWDAIEIHLLEVGQRNVGAKKELSGIAGCLIAFACKESVRKGHRGWVFLTPKTELIDHYRKTYGFRQAGRVMVSDDENSVKLIDKYF